MNKSEMTKTINGFDGVLKTITKQMMRSGETYEQAYARLAYEDPGFRALINKRTLMQDKNVRLLQPKAAEFTAKCDAPASIDTIEYELDNLTKRRQGTTGEDYTTAYDAVLQTPAGRELYRDHDHVLRSAQTS